MLTLADLAGLANTPWSRPDGLHWFVVVDGEASPGSMVDTFPTGMAASGPRCCGERPEEEQQQQQQLPGGKHRQVHNR